MTTAADASGNGNQGTLVGATWSTQGKYGGALSFNGSSSLVRVADSASLDLSTAMTLSAWIMPTASQSGWARIALGSAPVPALMRVRPARRSCAGLAPTPRSAAPVQI